MQYTHALQWAGLVSDSLPVTKFFICTERMTAWATRAGYSQVTGGYDGGQAEYVRVPFGAHC